VRENFSIFDFRLPILAEFRLTEKSIKPECDGRNASRRLSEADVFGRVAAGARVSRDPLWSACARESRADVCVSVLMADKSAS